MLECDHHVWRGGRAVYGSGLENHRTQQGTVGSNPTPSVRRVHQLGRCQSGRSGPPAKRLYEGNFVSQVRILSSPFHVALRCQVEPTLPRWVLLLLSAHVRCRRHDRPSETVASAPLYSRAPICQQSSEAFPRRDSGQLLSPSRWAAMPGASALDYPAAVHILTGQGRPRYRARTVVASAPQYRKFPT